MNFTSKTIESLLKPIENCTLNTVQEVLSQVIDGLKITQIGSLFHIQLVNSTTKYEVFIYDPANSYVLTGIHTETHVKSNEISKLVDRIKGFEINEKTKTITPNGFWVSIMYPVLGDLRCWCLFDGQQWLCTNAEIPSIDVQLVNEFFERHNMTINDLDKSRNYQLQINTLSGNLYVKRVVNRNNWTSDYDDKFLKMFPFKFNSKLNKQSIKPNNGIQHQIIKQYKNKQSFSNSLNNPDLLPIVHLSIEANHFFIHE